MTLHLVDASGRRVAGARTSAAAHREARRARYAGSHLQVVDGNRAWGATFPRDFYVPKEARGTTPIRMADAEFYLYETVVGPQGARRYGAIAFAGKSQKPLWHHWYPTEAARAKAIGDVVRGRLAHEKRKATRAVAEKAYRHDYKVGDVFDTSFGYDQTTRNFFEVVEVGEKTIVVREIAKSLVRQSGSGQDYVVGVRGKFVGKPIRVRPIMGNVKIEGHYASKWSGEPVYETSSGWGH